jgi:hypothetical protein
MNIVQEIEGGKILADRTWYFFLVRREGWMNGHPQRVRMRYKQAKNLAALVDTEVFYDPDQNFPDIGECKPGTQKAFIYGARKGKKKDE